MLACLDTCYYIGIGAILLVMVLFNVRCPFLQNGFHSLLRYDLRVDMFVNDNEVEPADVQRGWNSLLGPPENDATESEKEVPSEPEAAEATVKRDRSKSFSIPKPQEDSSDEDDGGVRCSGPGNGSSGLGGGGGPSSRRGSFGPKGGSASRRRNSGSQRNCFKKKNNIIFKRCHLDYNDDLPNSCIQLITSNLVELVNSESFLAQCDSIALMDDVLSLEKSLEYNKILEDLSAKN